MHLDPTPPPAAALPRSDAPGSPALHRSGAPDWPALHRSGAPDWPALWREGARTATLLAENLRDHTLPGRLGAGARILDFGAGCGAVALALAQKGLVTDAVSAEADVAALARMLPDVRCAAHGATPPLPYPDATFAAVCAASAFQHLPPSAGRVWLGELARVMQEGAVALVAICGPAGVRRRRETGRPGWRAVADADLERTGALFLPFTPLAAREGAPAGQAAYGHAHLVATWEGALQVEAIYAQALADGGDLVVLRRAGAAPEAVRPKSWQRFVRYGRRLLR